MANQAKANRKHSEPSGKAVLEGRVRKGSKSAGSEPEGEDSKGPGSSTAIVVGRVAKSHGLRGEVRVQASTDVEGRFSSGTELWLRGRDGRRTKRRIEASRPDRGAFLVRFEGVKDRDGADELRGFTIEVDENEVPAAPDGFFYYFQLVGCECHDASSGELGRVVEVIEDGGGHLLRLKTDKDSLLIPFVDAFLESVDIAAKRIDLDLPPGLVETCTSPS